MNGMEWNGIEWRERGDGVAFLHRILRFYVETPHPILNLKSTQKQRKTSKGTEAVCVHS